MAASHIKCACCTALVKEEIDLQLKKCESSQEEKNSTERNDIINNRAQKVISNYKENSEVTKRITRSATADVPILPGKRKRNDDKISVCDIQWQNQNTGQTQVSYYIIKPITDPVQVVPIVKEGANDTKTQTKYLCTHVETKLVDKQPVPYTPKKVPVRTVLDESQEETVDIKVFKVNHDHPYSVKSSRIKGASEEVILESLRLMRCNLDKAKEEEQRFKHRERQRRYRAKQRLQTRHLAKFTYIEEKDQKIVVKEKKQQEVVKEKKKQEIVKAKDQRKAAKSVKYSPYNRKLGRPCRYEHIMDEVGVLHTPSSSSCKQSRLLVLNKTKDVIKLGLESTKKNDGKKETSDFPKDSQDTRPSVFIDKNYVEDSGTKPFDEDRDPLYIGPDEFGGDTREEQETRIIIKEEVDLDASELSQEETIFVDPMRTEIMDSSCNPTNEEEERMKKLPEKMRIKNNLFQKCYRGKKNPAGKDLISTIFTRRESGYNPTVKKVIRRIFNETKKETEELRHEKSVDTKEEKESRNIVKEEVDLNAPELSQEDTLFIDPMKTEIMDYSSNPKNGEDERIKKLLDKLRLRRTLNPICYRNKKKESEKDLGSTLFNRKESRYNPTVKEVIRRMLNETEEETEELRRDYVKFRSKIYQSRYRARVNGRLNLEMEKMLQMNVEKYMAKILLDYEEILNNRRLKRGLVQQFSSDNASQSSVDTREEQESRSIIKEEVDLDSSEFSQEEEKEEDTLFVDPMETEIMDSSSDPKNEEERIKKLLEQMRLRNRLYQRRFRERKKGCFLFDRKESLYNTTVKEAMRHILNKNKKETEKLRLDWAKFRKNICRIRYRAKLKGRLNLEVEKMIKMKEEKYLAKMILDYEKILNNTRLKNGLAQQLSIENASQSSMDTREEQESRSIVKEEVDLDASELLKEEEETLFVDPVKTEIMDSSSNPKNEVEERIKELLEKLKIKNNLFQTRYHDKKKECEKHFSSAPFRRKESRYNHTVKEVMRRISNKTEKGTEKLRLDWVQFRKKIYQIRYRARLRGRLNFEMEKMLQMKEVKYLAKLVLDYEKILNNPRLECGLVQQFSSSENVSQSRMESDNSKSDISPKEEEEDTESYIIGI